MSANDNGNAFLGRGWSFPPAFDLDDGEIDMVNGAQDIEQSLRILLATSPGERVMDPEFGCGLKALVFHSLDSTLIARIKKVITKAVLFYESRIDLQSVEVAEQDELNGKLHIQLNYTIVSTNTRTNLVYPFYLLEATDATV